MPLPIEAGPEDLHRIAGETLSLVDEEIGKTYDLQEQAHTHAWDSKTIIAYSRNSRYPIN